jgi:hypothetical protein
MASRASDSGFHFYMDYVKCQQYFYWRYVKLLEPKLKATALIFGTAIHAGLEAWYKGQMNGDTADDRLDATHKAFSAAMQEGEDQYLEHEWYENDYSRGHTMLDKYIANYGKDNFKVISVEEPVQMALPTGDVFTGTIDLKVVQDGRVLIYDHKTTGWAMDLCIRSLAVSDQSTGYTLIHNVLHPEDPAVGLVYNVLRNNKSVYEFSRSLVVKSRVDQQRFMGDVTCILNEIASKMSNPESRWIRNTGNCYSYNRPCQYLELCQGANFESLMGVKYKLAESNKAKEDGDATGL